MDMTTAHILDSLGWAVIHSLWQGALAALAVYLFRAMTRDSQAGLRCGFELIALGLCFAAFIGTFSLKMLSPVSAVPMTTMINDIIIPSATAPVMTSPAEAASSLSGQPMTRYMPLLGIFWCLGFLLLATRYTVGFAMTRRLRTRGLSPAPNHWQDRFHTLVLNSGIFRKVTLHISDRVKGPMTFGFFKPVVLVPASFFSGLPADQIEAILLHEIAHIRRHDYLINLAQTAIKTILFYHPAIHYICRTVDEDREKACDDFAVNYTQNPTALAKGLATLRLSLTPPEFAMAASNKQKPLLRRLTRLTAPEESRRRRPGQNWGQVATSLAALLVAAGIYTAANVQFANAHPPETSDEKMTDDLHVSTDKKNYHFKTIRHNGRDITVKLAENNSRWVYFDNSWHNIDQNPQILDAMPEIPEAPLMPRPENFGKDYKFQKAANQYRVNLDYYIASLENNDCGTCTKDKLHWAIKQKNRVNNLVPDFDKDYLNLPAAPKPAPKPQPISVPLPELKPQVQPISFSTTDIPELAGPSVSTKIELSVPELRPVSVDDVTEDFERDMEKIDRTFEKALNRFEQAAEKFSKDPARYKSEFKQAQKEFAKISVQATTHRNKLEMNFNRKINELVVQEVNLQVSQIEEQVEREVSEALQQAEWAAEEARREADRTFEAHNYDHSSDAWSHPRPDTYGSAVLKNLRKDGLIDAGVETAEIYYKNGEMYVNGRDVPDQKEGKYCDLNYAYNIKKVEPMKIEIAPENITITNYKH